MIRRRLRAWWERGWKSREPQNVKVSHFVLVWANCHLWLIHSWPKEGRAMTEPLSDTELETLRILWEKHPLKPAQIEERFTWSIDNGTLRSTLAVLMAKGKVTRQKQGKAYLYSPVVERPSLLKSMAQGLSRILTGGSTA